MPDAHVNIRALVDLLFECHKFYNHLVGDQAMQQMTIDVNYHHPYNSDYFGSFYLWHERFGTKPKQKCKITSIFRYFFQIVYLKLSNLIIISKTTWMCAFQLIIKKEPKPLPVQHVSSIELFLIFLQAFFDWDSIHSGSIHSGKLIDPVILLYANVYYSVFRWL